MMERHLLLRQIVAAAVLTTLGVLPAAGEIAGPAITMRLIGGEPAMINAPDILNPRTNNGGIKTMTLNPLTGTIYGMDSYVSNNGRAETFLLDSSIVSTPSAPVDAQFGGLAPIAGSQYTGSVKGDGGTTDNQTINPPAATDITFNADYNEGALICIDVYNDFRTSEWAVQDDSVDWGHTVEPDGVSTAAQYATSDFNFGGYSQQEREGSAYLDHTTASGGTLSDVYRYAYHYYKGDPSNDEIRVAHVEAAFNTAPDNLTSGTRNSEHRKNSTGGNDYLLMNSSQIYALIPGGTVNGFAIRGETTDDAFDLYMLFYDSANTATYLAAVQATVPSDGSAMSYEVIDLDGASANTYLQLVDNTAGGGGADIQGTSLIFSADGATLYVAAYLDYSTGNGSYDTGRIYVYDVPEPATLGLLTVGFLPLLRRRRRRR